MKYNKIVYHFLLLLLVKFSYSCISSSNKKETTVIDIPNKNGTIKYNFYCLNDNKDNCSFVKYAVDGALNMFLTYFAKYVAPTSFDVVVDDFSKLKAGNEIDVPVVSLNTEFEPMNDEIKELFDVYPNSKTILKKVYKNSNDNMEDFILVANKINNEEEFNERMIIDYESFVFKGIIYGMNLDNEAKIINSINYNANLYASPNWTTPSYENVLLDNTESTIEKKNKELKRIIAVGDIHGDYDKLVKILTHAKLIDKNKNWIGKDSIFVQLGDLHEKGPSSKEILDLLIKIKKQASTKGGMVNLVIGNHDLYTISGTYDCAYIVDLKSSGSIEKRRKDYALSSKYGKLIRKEMEPVVVVDDIIFVHGGLLSKYAALGIDNLNKQVHDILINAPYDADVLDTDPLLSDDGPFLTRFFSKNDNETAVCEELSKVFEMTNTSRMVVGHTPQENGKINTLCNNKLIMTDIGLTGFYGSRFGYLEIKRDTNEYWAIYN